MKKIIPTSLVIPGHRDYKIAIEIEEEVLKRSGGLENLSREFPLLIRRAIDEIIDTPRTGRLRLEDTEKTEKTYIGTKIEILIRDFLKLPKGRLDLKIGDRDVDIKNTIGNNWMIPTEAIDHPCILIASDEKTFLCYLGVIVAHLDYLSMGKNKDSKRSISAEGFQHIHWILLKLPYPHNFWSVISEEKADYIVEPSVPSGTERIYRLFSTVLETPISRDIVESVARQKDYMKRLRKNGGARDRLEREGIALLSGAYDSNLIEMLGLPSCSKKEFISIQASSNDQKEMLQRSAHLPK